MLGIDSYDYFSVTMATRPVGSELFRNVPGLRVYVVVTHYKSVMLDMPQITFTSILKSGKPLSSRDLSSACMSKCE